MRELVEIQMLIDKHDLENSFTVGEFIQCDKDEVIVGIIPSNNNQEEDRFHYS
jgi:hypothetical protein